VSTTNAATKISRHGRGQGHRRLGVVFAVLLCLCASSLHASPLPKTKRVNSVKSLTNILSLVEKDNGDKARFTTMKLQIHLEGVYISQGTAIVLEPKKLSAAIGKLLGEDKSRKVVAKAILKRYQDGEFHEK
jgi:hypothetical protein